MASEILLDRSRSFGHEGNYLAGENIFGLILKQTPKPIEFRQDLDAELEHFYVLVSEYWKYEFGGNLQAVSFTWKPISEA